MGLNVYWMLIILTSFVTRVHGLPVELQQPEVWRHPCAASGSTVTGLPSLRRTLRAQLNSSLSVVTSLKTRFATRVTNLLSDSPNSYSLDRVTLMGSILPPDIFITQGRQPQNVVEVSSWHAAKLMVAYIFLEQSQYDEARLENLAYKTEFWSLLSWCGPGSLLKVLCSLTSFLDSQNSPLGLYPSRAVMGEHWREVNRDSMHRRDYVIVRELHEHLINMSTTLDL